MFKEVKMKKVLLLVFFLFSNKFCDAMKPELVKITKSKAGAIFIFKEENNQQIIFTSRTLVDKLSQSDLEILKYVSAIWNCKNEKDLNKIKYFKKILLNILGISMDDLNLNTLKYSENGKTLLHQLVRDNKYYLAMLFGMITCDYNTIEEYLPVKKNGNNFISSYVNLLDSSGLAAIDYAKTTEMSKMLQKYGAIQFMRS